MSDPTTTAGVSTSERPEVRSISIELEYKHPHHVPSDAEYPSDVGLRGRIEDNLTPGLFRIYVRRKSSKDTTVNAVTLKGIDHPHDFPSNIDVDELERVVLSICYRHIHEETKVRTQFLVQFIHRTAPGHRPKKAEVTVGLDPLPDGLPHERPSSATTDAHLQDWEKRTSEWTDRSEPRPSERRPEPFQETYSPYSETNRRRNEENWRERFLRNLPEPTRPTYDAEPVPERRTHLFSPEMMGVDVERMSPNVQRMYADSVLPFAILNNSMQLAFQGFAASIDTLTKASQEQQRLHSMQMAIMLDREQQLMSLPLKFLDVEAANKGQQAEIMRQSHQYYMDALRIRADVSTREKGHEISQLQSQYQLADLQRQLFEQGDKKEREEASAFRRDLMRNLGPTVIQGLGLFLEHFGKPQLAAAAKATGMMVEGIVGAADAQASSVPGAPPSPPPTEPAPGPSIPRRSLRLQDVASPEDIQLQPIRSLCRMANVAFGEDDRARLRAVLSPDEWGALERALVGSTDAECMLALSQFMSSVATDPPRQERLMGTLTPGQRSILETIGAVFQGTRPQLDYQVELRPRRTVLRQHVASHGQEAGPVSQGTIPVPPDDPISNAGPSIPVPPPEIDPPRPSTTTTAEIDDVPRPSRAPASEDAQVATEDKDALIAKLREELALAQAKTNTEPDPTSSDDSPNGSTSRKRKKPPKTPRKR